MEIAIYQIPSSKQSYNDAQELSEDFNSIKKIQSETKDILTEIKNNLQGNSKSG